MSRLCMRVCVFQVHGVNVVKVGHKQVVSLIRQGGNSLLMKVVSVTRKPESEEVVRKKGEQCVYMSPILSIYHRRLVAPKLGRTGLW